MTVWPDTTLQQRMRTAQSCHLQSGSLHCLRLRGKLHPHSLSWQYYEGECKCKAGATHSHTHNQCPPVCMASSICSVASLSSSHMHMSRQYLSGTTVSLHSQSRKAARSTKPCRSSRVCLMLLARCVLLNGTFTRAYSITWKLSPALSCI